MTNSAPVPLADAAARKAIADDIRVNIVVEAAAGTGKTTSLVARLMTLFRSGALDGESRLAAVTFTHKAASELRERLERELQAALAAAVPGSQEDGILRAASAALPECHIGTIHSFCGRLLRERPVEAGTGLDFRELDDAEDRLLRRKAWEEFAGVLRSGGHRQLRKTFERYGLDEETLGQGFEKYADYPDADEWIGAAGGAEIGTAAFAAGTGRYHAGLEALRPLLADAVCGTDPLLPVLQILDRRWNRLPRPLQPADAFRLSCVLKNVTRVVQKQWTQFGLTGAEAKDQLAAYAAFYEETVRPFRRECLAAVYAAALAAYREAAAVYDRLRREGGVLNFQDLLLLTARLLREYPDVRADLAARYPRLLVDEVQDTDPVQAEIMFLLASADPAETEWRRCRPRPGSLFIVGDPKQSIYRFRRADIEVYQEVKRLIAENGGRELGLTVNFRSQPAVLEWVNRTFLLPEEMETAPDEFIAESGRFARRESPYSPAYRSLAPGLPPAEEGFRGVFALQTLPCSRRDGVGDREMVQDEARRIARFIRHAAGGGLQLPAREGTRPARPEDFLIITYQKAAAAVYADAVRAAGIPCQVSSGGTLAGSRALGLLRGYLEAMALPDDPVLLTAVLRGGLFGIDDARLYRWKKAGGGFDLFAPVPEAGEEALREIFAGMLAHRRLLETAEPVLAAGRIAEDLGLWPLACLGDDADGGAAALAAALEQLAAERQTIATPGKLAERLGWIIGNHDADPLPAGGKTESAVRVMNLHKTKGLEAPVVFLTSTRTVKKHRPVFSMRRENGRAAGAMALCGGEFGSTVLAQPAEWEDIAASEELFLAAERTRLNYVAATRAGSALIVSVHRSGKIWQSAFLPEYIPGESISDILPEPADSPLPETEPSNSVRIDAEALRAADAMRPARRESMLRETYRTERAAGGGSLPVPAGVFSPAMEEGDILHRLLESCGGGDELLRTAEDLLRERQLPAAGAEELVRTALAARASAVWKRSLRAERLFREAPYSLPAGDGAEAVLERGVIDLVFREKDGWVIVDYKSDRAGGGDGADRHAAQLAAYARAWSRITGEPVTETGIYFFRSGEYVVLPCT